MCALRPLAVVLLSSLAALPLTAQGLPCRPCAGVVTDAPEAVAGALSDIARVGSRLEEGSPLVVAWEVDPATVDAGSTGAAARAVRQAGGTPWVALAFSTPAPLTANAQRLQGELEAAARLGAALPAGAFVQILWRPEGSTPTSAPDPVQYAFLLKRAAVAVGGAGAEARIATMPLPADVAWIERLYAEEVAAYVEAAALAPAPADTMAAAIAALERLDPGRPVVLDALPFPALPAETLADAARAAASGVALTLFELPPPAPAPEPMPEAAAPPASGAAAPATPPATAPPAGPTLVARLAPLVLLAREFAGDLSYDPTSSPSGASEAWAFVRGEDLGLRVIALVPPATESLTLRFADPELRRPSRFPLSARQTSPPAGEVRGGALEILLAGAGRVEVLGIERPTAAEREGVEEEMTIATEREIPVEEILRRLQAFEDAQARRLVHYTATNTTHLRFQPAAGTQTIEATLRGPFFFSPEEGSDWAWQDLFVNGVRWRSKTIPEIPLVQPEKTAAMPVEIHFSKQYRYRLRGTDTVDGRPAWVVDFEPAVEASPNGRPLSQGTVWVDREVGARLRTRAVQLGLQGEVISNEETLYYTPIDELGAPAPWSPQSYVLPLRLVAQQILSVVNAAVVVERETLLSGVLINGPDFAERRRQVAETDVTMVRDTDRGLRYLVKDEEGERVVKEGFDTNKLFALGGVFYDDALDYPLPLAGLNYFNFDFRGTGKQLNVFFGGALIVADIAEPRLFGSRFDAGADAFVFAFPSTDTFYRDDREVPGEEVESTTGNLGLKLGHPLGSFGKVNGEYTLRYTRYGETDNTRPDFVLPSDTLTHSLDLRTSYARAGWRASVSGSYNLRSDWDFWGLPGNAEFDPEAEDYALWQASVAKNWYLPGFRKLGLEVNYAGGQDLDRFSKYEFGFFGATRVHGYQSNRVRAEEVWAAHASYGFELGELFRIEAVGDAAWATDESTGLESELLAGVGVQGTFMGPWQTVVNLDLGVPVAGPDDGFVLYVVFLKLFR